MLSASTTISNYTCKYLESTRPVYAIVACHPSMPKSRKTIVNTMFYTTPFQSSSKAETYNVITTYLHKDHANTQCAKLKEALDIECYLEKFQLIDISYYAYMMKVPMIVLMNSYCDLDVKQEVIDLFYTARILNDPRDYKL